jgi:hypothetical protein
LANIARGISSAAVSFVVVGIAFPYLLEFFSSAISTYVQLPPSAGVWTAFILIGALFAVTSFLQNAYSKGEYPWLFGRIGAGVASLVLFTYILLLVPKSDGSTAIQATGLLTLIYLAVVLSYAYLILDFIDARRSRVSRLDRQGPVV